jgi:hypothetical protein
MLLKTSAFVLYARAPLSSEPCWTIVVGMVFESSVSGLPPLWLCGQGGEIHRTAGDLASIGDPPASGEHRGRRINDVL